jgi:diadenosine tetraphosphate (Ap4A) HIT family hydrolase
MEPVTCPFCNPSDNDVIVRNELCYARYDQYPVSKGHLLVIPFRHIANFFDTTKEEKNSLFELIEACKTILNEQYTPDGYNIGMNIGEVAGQTVMHCHVHVIPRYRGDSDSPRGGIRGVIPAKKDY